MLKESKLKRIDFKKGEFEANGKTYYIEYELSISRYKQEAKLIPQLTFGRTFKEMRDAMGNIINLYNDDKKVEAMHGMYNLYTTFDKNIQDRVDPALEICTLYINTKDEDRATYDEKLSKEKIKDWESEGINTNDFFVFALNLQEGFIEDWQQLSQSGSTKKEQK